MGYQKISLQAGYNMIGVQFTQIGGTAYGLAEVGKLGEGMSGFDEDGAFATDLQVWNGVGYDFYGWSGTSGSELLDDDTIDNKWVDDYFQPAEIETPEGSGFWIKAEKASTILVKGEVPTNTTYSVTLQAGYNLIANPYPCAVEIASFGMLDESFSGFDEDGAFATDFQVWNGVGYDFYGWSGTSGSELLDDDSIDNKWVDDYFQPATALVPAGHAVWIKAEKAGTLTFSSPIK